MQRIMIIYGAAAGAIAIGSAIWGITASGDGPALQSLEWLGYLVMLVALSMIFVGIKRYRDQQLGGVITFGKAMLVGLGTAMVASIVYVIVWEIYLAATDYSFIELYTDGLIAAEEAKGMRGEELIVMMVEMEDMKMRYANPLFRVPMTFLEIFPVGFLITLISAAILRNSKVLPATD